MPTDKYADKAVEKMKDGTFYIVSQSYNMEHINKRYKEISRAYEKCASRYEGDEEYHSWTKIGAMVETKAN